MLLEATKKYDDSIRCFNFGLSNENESRELYFDSEGSGLASIYKRDLRPFGISFDGYELIELKTLDDFVDEISFQESIDLLKIDVEGNELKVLQGAQKLIKQKRIHNIQIEFGGADIDSRTFLRDFWILLSDDFKMYRILKNDLIEIKNYDERLEVFSCSNFLFCLKENI